MHNFRVTEGGSSNRLVSGGSMKAHQLEDALIFNVFSMAV
jgi:hypothetical protein